MQCWVSSAHSPGSWRRDADGKFITGTVILNDGGINIGKRASGIDM
jgi:hypothetical protein